MIFFVKYIFQRHNGKLKYYMIMVYYVFEICIFAENKKFGIMKKYFLNISLLAVALVFNSCSNSPAYYIENGNDTILSFVYVPDEYNAKWNVIVKDSITSDKDIHDLFEKSGLFRKLKRQADKSELNFSEHFFLYTKKDATTFGSCNYHNFYLEGFLSGPSEIRRKEHYVYYLNSKEEYSRQQDELHNVINMQMNKIGEAVLKGKKPYYGEDLSPVENYLDENIGDFTPLRCGKITKIGDYYVVRYIYKVKNIFGGTIKCDKIFTINGFGEIVGVEDYVE